MSKRQSSKYKIDRRMGENIWGRPKSSVNRRSYGPGQHGQRRKGKMSDFGIQLRAKQKLKGYYGDVTEKQFKRTYQEAAQMKGDTGQNLIGLLEQRLDMVVYRAKFAPTIFSARQVVSHGHIYVNGVKCNIASRRVRPGDVVSLGKKAKEMALIAEAQSLPERDLPEAEFCQWLTSEIGVAAIPLSAFYGDGFDQRVVRFCFAKKDETLRAAIERLRRL